MRILLICCWCCLALIAAEPSHETQVARGTDASYDYLEYLPAAYHERSPDDRFPHGPKGSACAAPGGSGGMGEG